MKEMRRPFQPMQFAGRTVVLLAQRAGVSKEVRDPNDHAISDHLLEEMGLGEVEDWLTERHPNLIVKRCGEERDELVRLFPPPSPEHTETLRYLAKTHGMYFDEKQPMSFVVIDFDDDRQMMEFKLRWA